ncbi:MAG: hypothetical protein SNI87_00355 [Rikenellaceae bacterium]
MKKRSSKTVSQQCRFYGVENIFDYMVDTYICTGDPLRLIKLYKELRRDARTLFIRYCFEDMNPEYKKEIISAIVNYK